MSSDSGADLGDYDGSGLPGLSPVHHLFLQALLSRRVTTEETAVKIHERCCKILGTAHRRNEFADYIAAINGHLHKLGFTLKRADDPYSGPAGGSKPVLVFCNVRDDHLARQATDLSPQEIAYFRELIREIMEAPNMAFSVKLNDATSLGKDMTPKVTRTTCQTLLTTFVNKGWLHLSSKHDASYSLSVRSLHELDGYLAQEFEDIVNECKCADCDEFVSLGVGCKNSQCSTKMHLACFKRARRTTPSCPQCRTQWPAEANDMKAIGEGALSAKERRRSTKGRASGIGASGFQPINPDDDEEDEEDAEEQEALRRQGRRPTKQSQSQRMQQDEEDDEEQDELATPAPPTTRRRHR